VITSESAFDHATTVERLIGAITARGLTVFCRVDHAAGAREVGLDLPPEEVILFGNPRAGTPLMQTSPAVGYELPLRIAVWQQEDGVRLAHRDPREFADLFGLEDLRGTLDQIAALLDALTADAAGGRP
jgi:uncharacterized protein (DUF302 family)